MTAAQNAPGVATPAQINGWVAQLSHDAYQVRQSAAERLIAAGDASRRALSPLAQSPDPELRAAAQRILAQIETVDLRRRLDAFAADVDGSAGLTLPGWEQFQKIVGKDARARGLFVEMQRQEAPLLALAFRSPVNEFVAVWEARLGRLIQGQVSGYRNSTPPVASAAAVVFIACQPSFPQSDQVVGAVAQLIYRSPFQETLRTGDNRSALQRLVTEWLVNCENTNDMSILERINLAMACQLTEASPWAVKIATRSGEYQKVATATRVEALKFLAQNGNREAIDALEPLLEDATVFYSSDRNTRLIGVKIDSDVEIRDIALIVLLQLTNQRAPEYGYMHAQRPAVRDFTPESMFPRSVEQRQVAIEKWRRWKAAQK